MGILKRIMERGAKPITWGDDPGQSVDGIVTVVREKQLQEYKSTRLETWEDGTPKLTPIITIDTGLQEDDEDDGLRDLYCRGGVYTALSEALRKAFPKGAPGDSALVGYDLYVELVDTVPASDPDMSDRKRFELRLTKPKAAKS